MGGARRGWFWLIRVLGGWGDVGMDGEGEERIFYALLGLWGSRVAGGIMRRWGAGVRILGSSVSGRKVVMGAVER